MGKQDKQNCYLMLYKPFPTREEETPEVIKVKDRQTLDRLISALCHACGTNDVSWNSEIEYLRTIDEEELEKQATRLCTGGKLDWRENELILETEEIAKFYTSYFKTRYIVGKQGDYISNLYVSNISEELTKQKE